jgi:hypothetical protein
MRPFSLLLLFLVCALTACTQKQRCDPEARDARAVVDVAGSAYVTFQDTTSGARVVFTRFNATGSFDPPLQPSRVAGSGGVVGDRPAVATDRYGTVYLAWEENRGGPTPRIVFSRAE